MQSVGSKRHTGSADADAPSHAGRTVTSSQSQQPQQVVVLGGGSKFKKLTNKKELVEAQRKMAPAYSTALPLTRFIMRNPKGDGSSKEAEDALATQLRVVESGVNVTIRRYNDLKLEADRKAMELREALDVMNAIKIDNDALSEMKKKQNYESLRITELQELIKGMLDHIEVKVHYRRQLEYMKRRLYVNEVAYDAHLNAMEVAMAALHKEAQQVEDIQLSLENGAVLSANELEQVEMQLHIEKGLRQKLGRWRQNEYKNAAHMEDWRMERDNMQKELMAELRGDMSQEQLQRLERKISDAEVNSRELQAQSEQTMKAMNELEEVFRQLQQVTGVNTFEEMIQKFSAQRSNTQALQEEKRQAEERLAAVKAAKDETEQAFSRMRAQGVGSTELNREILDKLNGQIGRERMEMKINRAMNERLHAVMIDMTQGAAGLARRLQPFMHLLEADGHATLSIDHKQHRTVKKASGKSHEQLTEEAVHALTVTETVAVKMTDLIGEKESSARFGSSSGATLDDDKSLGSEQSLESTSFSLDDFSNVNRNNLRVRSSVRKKDIERLEASKEEDLGSVLLADGLDDLPVDDLLVNIEDLVPSRQLVKASSHRQHAEIIRKRELAVKKQRYLERLAAADEKEKGLLQSLAARRKAQRDHASKLCVMPTIVGLPKGLTLRDEPMKKAEVFLSAMPELS